MNPNDQNYPLRLDILQFFLDALNSAKNENMIKRTSAQLWHAMREKGYSQEETNRELIYLVETGHVKKKTETSTHDSFNRLTRKTVKSKFTTTEYNLSQKGRDQMESPSQIHQEERNETTGQYVKQQIIEGFVSKQTGFNYKKLIRLLTELNSCHASGYPYSTAMLIRAILDHIPPLLSVLTFDEVVSNYSWGQTDRKYMRSLLEFKNEADDALHRQISGREDLLDIDHIPPSIRINRLLQECLVDVPERQIAPRIDDKEKGKKHGGNIKISLQNGSKITWANYSQHFYVWSSFLILLDIDNYNSQRPDYISASLQGKTIDGEEWTGSHFNFEKGDKPDAEYRVEAAEVKKVQAFVSDHMPDNQTRKPIPEIDDKGLTLVLKTKSGAEFSIEIPREKITTG